MEECKQKLIFRGNVIPDPFSLHKMVGWRIKKEQVWQNGHQFFIRTLRNFFAKSMSHQICYYVWSQTIRKAKHTDIINVNLLKKSFTTLYLRNQNTAF